MPKLIAILIALGFASTALAGEVALIAHPDVAETSLSAKDVKSILTGRKTTWSAGPIRLVVLADGPVHEQALADFVQRSSSQFSAHWKKLAFSGQGELPEQAKDDAAAIAYVAATPGAFGYVAQESVTDAVKVLSVQ